MKRFSWGLIMVAALFSGCLKTEKGCPFKDLNIVAPASEQQQIEAYLASNNLAASKHTSGLYYQVVTPGAGVTPNLCSVVSVGYTGKLTNGHVFDQKPIITFDLGRVIEGWKKGLPLIQRGGKIRLYIPPSLGYGPVDVKDQNNNVVIPANSVLIFDVEMFEVN